ncbi:SDR family oxidoreductase [Leptolyngbya sp. AN03gr2]|uniref:SDR family oxidoreductase n=1 Tax=unclassified Leptolyngbya TaxID=2650499 RepID=UPI003D31086B
MSQTSQRIALVTGVGRPQGIGFEVCRQLAKQGLMVILTARDAEKAESNAKQLTEQGLNVLPKCLDVSSDRSVHQLATEIEAEFSKLDVLVNNAAINFDFQQPTIGVDLNTVHETLETNFFGAWRTCEAFLPLIRQSEHGRIVNVSSEAASFSSPDGMANKGGVLPSYCVSKAALNAFTVKFATALKDTGVLVNAVCPGYTATYPGAEAIGARPSEEGAASVMWAALLPDSGPTGGFFRDGKPLPW